ncbi:Uncharacterised protein [[Clostridium] sordellii]|uniref:hypothetical protein n=1 Tax=Paraclostridium sordellii TaxID=1505 RepID=UPI0005E413D4|nr:hypothetical protein [Paeniclostridium sordellii]CEQ01580.1 Uncharacterised protein [[Clostridium] sordellii] [Paeniclostridium sordellii]
MLGSKSLLKIDINKNNDCVIKIDPSTYARLTDIERRILNCHTSQILEILKEKYERKGDNIWRK